ncbi:hypothetical protein RF819_16945 [Rhodoferax fermentans]|uniref:Uncharacterized protein n=1 Tax=Rhodoferax fermentans TaxID=28066 RepID=A0A1T1AVR0_RHOFE|nr:hypothetical protein RF819_16945 [Rhodoferax fermentans]
MAGRTITHEERRRVFALRRESNTYSQHKPGRVPPADSPNRPELARLWFAAHQLTQKRQLRTFSYCGFRFGVVYVGESLCVLDWALRKVLVKPPGSIATLGTILGNAKVFHQ